MSNKANIVGVSATASLATVVGNYDINYLKKNLIDKYYPLSDEGRNRIHNKFYKQLEIYDREKIDIRVKVIDVPEQDAITKDNVTIKINAVIYFNIFDAKKAMLSVQNCFYAVTQLAQTTMRNLVGSVTLDELLSDRERISNEMCAIVDKATDDWGVKIQNVELINYVIPHFHIFLPD